MSTSPPTEDETEAWELMVGEGLIKEVRELGPVRRVSQHEHRNPK